jgi:hypothetical protein
MLVLRCSKIVGVSNVPIGIKRKACKKTAEEKRTADVNASFAMIIFDQINFEKKTNIYIGNS